MITIYGIDGCRPCKSAIKLARLYGLEHDFIRITTDEMRSDIKYRIGVRGNLTVPQIFIDDEYIGEYREFREWIEKQKFNTVM